jgi:hypothetical protein
VKASEIDYQVAVFANERKFLNQVLRIIDKKISDFVREIEDWFTEIFGFKDPEQSALIQGFIKFCD